MFRRELSQSRRSLPGQPGISRRAILRGVGGGLTASLLASLGIDLADYEEGPSLGTPAAAATSPVPTLADLWSGRAEFVPDGRDFATGGMHFLSAWWFGSQLWAYYIKDDRGVGLAVSGDNGLSFRDVGMPVLSPGPGSWDNTFATFSGVWFEGNAGYLVYEGKGSSPGDVGLATSTDRVHWTKVSVSAPLLTHSGGHERNNIGTPSLYRTGGKWYLFYHSYGSRTNSPDDVQICVATGTDLRALTKYSGNPIIRTGDSGYDAGTIGKRSQVFASGGYYYLVYEVSTDPVGSNFEVSNWSSSIARSTDLLHWEKLGRPVLPQTGSGFGFDGPELIATSDGRLHIYYRARQGDGGPTKRATLRFKTPWSGLTFEAETQLSHLVGRRDSDGWSCNVRDDRSGWMCYGPYTTAVPAGGRTATFRLLVDNNTADDNPVVTLDVNDATHSNPLASVVVRRRMFSRAGAYQDFSLNFPAPTQRALEFRTFWHRTAYVREDRVMVK